MLKIFEQNFCKILERLQTIQTDASRNKFSDGSPLKKFINFESINSLKKVMYNEFQDIDGYSSMQLNTESSLMDMNLDRACFRGEAKEVLEIIEALAGNTNTYYSQGGHVSVVGINAKTLTRSKIVIDITFITDYDYETQSFSQTMKVCE